MLTYNREGEIWVLHIIKFNPHKVKSIEGVTHREPDTIPNKIKSRVWFDRSLLLNDHSFAFLSVPPEEVQQILDEAKVAA